MTNFTTITAGGRIIDTSRVSVDDVDISDLAHGLAGINRYHGATHPYFNVADHSRLVAGIVRRSYEHANLVQTPPAMYLAALLHDAHEALTGDIVSPVKRLLGDSYTELEHRLDSVIAERFGIPVHMLWHEEIKRADRLAGHAEVYFFVHSDAWPAFEPWGFEPDRVWRAVLEKRIPDPRDFVRSPETAAQLWRAEVEQISARLAA